MPPSDPSTWSWTTPKGDTLVDPGAPVANWAASRGPHQRLPEPLRTFTMLMSDAVACRGGGHPGQSKKNGQSKFHSAHHNSHTSSQEERAELGKNAKER